MKLFEDTKNHICIEFNGTNKPRDITIAQADLRDDYIYEGEEYEQAGYIIVPENWEDITIDEINRYPNSFHFLSPDGLLFYWPVYAIKYVEEYEKTVGLGIDNIIYDFCEDVRMYRYEKFEKRHFKAVYKYLIWLKENNFNCDQLSLNKSINGWIIKFI